MNELVIQNALEMILNGDCDVSDTAFEELVSVTSFAEAGALSRDNGLVLRMSDGSEFQLCIVKSR